MILYCVVVAFYCSCHIVEIFSGAEIAAVYQSEVVVVCLA